jgi:hypothetical protein
VVLWDDDPLENDILDVQSIAVPYEGTEEPLRLQPSRRQTVAGSPIYLNASGSGVEYTFGVDQSPVGSDHQLRRHGASVAVFRPETVGEYTLRATADTGATATTTVTVESRDTLIDEYAPRYYYDSAEEYRPTRYEAALENAVLIDDSELGDPVLEESPTMLDLQTYQGGPVVDLQGGESDYQDYQTDYPPTIYASVNESVTYRGERYTALTYWAFYTYDPKSDGISSLLSHESDLETVSVLLNESGPQWVAASQHFGGELREWNKPPRSGTHLHVYPAVGAHSSFLANTGRFSGDGFLPQLQFANLGGATLLPGTSYRDYTGNDTVFASTTDADQQYDIVPLTGNEVWRDFNGGFGDAADEGPVPMQRQRWNDLGNWIAESVYPDEEQRGATFDSLSVSPADDNLTVTAEIENTGYKPHEFTVYAFSKPTNQTWTAENRSYLGQFHVPVGTNQAVPVTGVLNQSGSTSGAYDVSVSISLYPTRTTEREDIEDRTVVEDAYTVSGESPPPLIGAEGPPQSLDGDGKFEDVNGDGVANLFDALDYYNNRDSSVIENNPEEFDFDGDGPAGTIFDALELYNQIQAA